MIFRGGRSKFPRQQQRIYFLQLKQKGANFQIIFD